MKNTIILMMVSVAVLALTNSCNKDDMPDMSKYTIYTTGQYYGVGGNLSCYWKNSERTDVPDLAPDYYLSREIFVSNGDVYLAGARYISEDPMNTTLGPSYWKNGVRTDLDMGDYTSGRTEYIKVANGKVYTAGHVFKNTGAWYENEIKYCYWINTERTDITDFPENYSDAYVAGIFVYSNDVYVCGGYRKGDEYHVCYWKNGVLRTDMSETSKYTRPLPSIFVDNGKVYIGGAINTGNMTSDYRQIFEACYWVDGQFVKVDNNGQVAAIFVENGTVYTGGVDTSTSPYTACYWKGTSKTSVMHRAIINGLHVKDGIVFTAGFRFELAGLENNYYPCYWVNTKRVDLPFPAKDNYYKWNNEAYSIFVE